MEIVCFSEFCLLRRKAEVIASVLKFCRSAAIFCHEIVKIEVVELSVLSDYCVLDFFSELFHNFDSFLNCDFFVPLDYNILRFFRGVNIFLIKNYIFFVLIRYI